MDIIEVICSFDSAIKKAMDEDEGILRTIFDVFPGSVPVKAEKLDKEESVEKPIDNMGLWNAIGPTSPDHVSKIVGKPYKGNSPKPYWVAKRATELFGPCGIGWGYDILDSKIEQGDPDTKIHMCIVEFWYNWQGKIGKIKAYGQTAFSGVRSSGLPYTDEDAPKKSVTDGLIKAMSYAGFASDIFMGRWDDSKYVEGLVAAQKEAEKSAKAEEKTVTIKASELKNPELVVKESATEDADIPDLFQDTTEEKQQANPNDLIGQEHLVILKDARTKAGVEREWVERYMKEMFEKTTAKSLTIKEFDSMIDYINNGLPQDKIDKVLSYVEQKYKKWEAAPARAAENAYCIKTYGCKMDHLFGSLTVPYLKGIEARAKNAGAA